MASAPEGKSSDARYLRVLYRRYIKRLRHFLSRRTRSQEVAEELAQETFARLAERGNLAELKNARDYLHKIALNLLAETRERRRAETHVPLLAKLSYTPTATSELEAEQAARLEALKRAVERLPRRHQSVLQLWGMGFIYRDIAHMLGVSEAVVGQDLMHARQKLRKELQSSGQG